jgi:hypothetical protein
MKIKRLNSLLFLKTIGTLELTVASIFAYIAFSSNFINLALGNALVSLGFAILGIRSFYIAHKDYRYFLRHKGEKQHGD